MSWIRLQLFYRCNKMTPNRYNNIFKKNIIIFISCHYKKLKINFGKVIWTIYNDGLALNTSSFNMKRHLSHAKTYQWKDPYVVPLDKMIRHFVKTFHKEKHDSKLVIMIMIISIINMISLLFLFFVNSPFT